MSILIKGVKPPASCFECPFRVEGEDVADFCCVPALEFVWCKYDKRPEDCPLVEIPKHGRLIDADALASVYENSHLSVVAKILADAPTVIEAEE